ncbi:OmpA family protein [Spirosoma validum]|uniref:OmpA family protein n=1 Tax=Spirosoma validum TaxID=2771355 RepID=A0A927GH03_9BACT|nr:OmpA family protein [Spirosoma validum]MBD2757421.1 OmpA family protein [Spirosoma validum]
MATDLLNHLRAAFTPSAVTDLARVLGEKAEPTQKAMDGLLPAITSGVIHRASDQEGAATLYNLLRSTPLDTDPNVVQLVETNSHRQKAAESGNALLKQLYDERVHRLTDTTAQYSGVSLGSATTLTGLVMSVLMGFLSKQVTTRNLTQPQLVALLAGETDIVRGAIPATLATLLGWFIGTDIPSRPITTTTPTPTRTEPVTAVRQDEPKAAAFPWLRWVLIGLGLLLLFFFLTRMCGREKTETTTSSDSTTSSTGVATDTLASDLNGNEAGPEVRVGVDLPGGRKLNVAENSFNYALAQFLSTKGGQLPKVFTFDNLTFETGSARITAAAQANVDDLIQIMQAYPNLQIRIEGNTDSTGDDAINDPLSADRAEAVKDALVKAGIQASRIATRERGDSKPVASNETEAGRAKNRRIDIIVTKL